MRVCLVLALVLWLGQTKAEEVVEDDMVIIEADAEESSRHGRQYLVNFPGPAAGATLLESGLFQKPELNPPCRTEEGLFGRCMTVNECHPERKIVKTEPKDTWIFGLYNTCSYENPKGKQVFATCCTDSYPINVAPRLPTPSKNLLARKKCSPMPTSAKCIYNGNRIVGGGEAASHEFPYMAALMKVSPYSGKPRQFCGGSLIDESHVLTAAHCIEGMSASDVKTLRVYLGAHNIKNGARTEHRVVRIIKHIDFEPRTLANDIAILTLETPARIGGTINTVCLPDNDYSYYNQIATVAGWGSKGEGKGQPSQLYKVDVRVWSNKQCANTYNNRIPGRIEDNMLCAADNGRDSCSGDSGGPLFIRRGSSKVQIGIVSWGIGCARGDSPGVYTRVTKMVDWIQRIQKCY